MERKIEVGVLKARLPFKEVSAGQTQSAYCVLDFNLWHHRLMSERREV